MRILFLFILKLLLSCTSNPFWDDPGTVELVLSGNISTENNNMNVPVSVYLETFDIYTRTDQDGDFSITIQNTQSTDGSVSGSLKIHFFIYNYQLDSAVVNFVNGRLSDNQSDFSSDGVLVKPVQLRIADKLARGPEEMPEEGLAEEALLESGQIVIKPAKPNSLRKS